MSPQTEPIKPSGKDKPLLRRIFQTYPKLIWAVVSHNLQWKLLALFLAICLWVGLILQDPTLTRERTFTGVPLSITGADTLRRNGFIVVQGLEEENATVKLKADIPQKLYNDATYANYNPRLDLSKISEAGEQTLKVSTTSSTTYGTVTEVSPAEIAIVVDEYITNYRIPVQVETTGAYPDGFYGTTPTLDLAAVTVSGPQDIVSQIARVVLTYDLSQVPARTGALQTALPPHYVDAAGNELDSTLLEPTTGGVLLRSIVVQQTIVAAKSLPINQTALTSGTPKKGYEIKSVTVSPAVLIAAGDETALSTLNALFAEAAVDVSGRDASFTSEIRITKPDNVVYLSAETVHVIVDIGPVMATQTFADVPLTVEKTPDGLTAVTETAEVSVTLTGPALSMETMRASKLTAYIDASNLSAGTYDLPIRLTIGHDDADQFTFAIVPESVSVTLSSP